MTLTACSNKIEPVPIQCTETTKCESVYLDIQTNGDLVEYALKEKYMIYQCKILVKTYRECIKIHNQKL